jgi:putative zinc finger/helix-turn-helix YgiT family protein
MSQEKPIDTMAGQDCPFCAKGRFELCQVDYKATTSDEPEEIVKGVWVERCSICGEMVFPSESSRYIDAVLAEKSEQLTPAELEQIRKRLGVDQTEMSEILGLGGRTYHRWEKGTQYPSRSMCYYIRLLGKFPTVFNWLRTHSWRHEKPNVKLSSRHDEITRKFPDLANSPWRHDEIKDSFNPARGLTAVFK